MIAGGLHHAHIDWKIRPFREADRVDERDVSGPVVFRQAVDAQPSTKTAAFGLNEVVPQRRELDLARHDIRFEAKRAAGRVVEPEIDAGELPVVTEPQARAVPGFVSCTLRSGLRKFTGAKGAHRGGRGSRTNLTSVPPGGRRPARARARRAGFRRARWSRMKTLRPPMPGGRRATTERGQSHAAPLTARPSGPRASHRSGSTTRPDGIGQAGGRIATPESAAQLGRPC